MKKALPTSTRPPLMAALAVLVLPLLATLTGCSRGTTVSSGADPAVVTFLHHYFDTWSAKDMDGYGRCFAEQARICFISAKGEIVSQGTTDFLHGQTLAHEQSSSPMTERPLQITLQGDDRVKQAAVTWVLSKGLMEERGTDFFTLQHDGGQWKIVSLVFYGQ